MNTFERQFERVPAAHVVTPFQVDHIVARQHRGRDTLGNLAFVCLRCNGHKSDKTGYTDPETGQVVPLFNPRRDLWGDHFRLVATGLFEPLTETGRATLRLLQLNKTGPGRGTSVARGGRPLCSARVTPHDVSFTPSRPSPSVG